MEYILKRRPLPKPRFTIGFLDENAYDEFHSYLMEGVFEAAHKYDLNIIRFGHFEAHITYKSDLQINMVLDQIERYSLDGLLFLGWARVAAFENHESFKRRFDGIPILSVGAGFPDIPNIIFPGDKYIHEILLHLINIHGFKKIAFIAPFWPDRRLDVYIKTMKEYGIYDPRLCVNETLIANLDVPQRGRKAVSILLDERQAAFEAIVSLYNDETRAIVEELQFRGFNIPNDIAVTSYEDSEIGRLFSPAFTTVYFPWRELGFYACEKMYQLLTDGHIPLSTVVPGRIIIRDSCGCISHPVRHAKAGKIIAAWKLLGEINGSELRKIGQELQKTINYPDLELAALIKAFLTDFQERSNTVFLNELGLQIGKIPNYRNLQEIENLVSDMRILLLPYVVYDKEALLWAENLLQQAQVLLQEQKVLAWEREEVQSNTINFILQEIGQILVRNFKISSLMDSLAANLNRLNIPGCYVFIFQNKEIQKNLFDSVELVFEYCDHQRIRLENNATGDARRILTEVLFSKNRPYRMMAQLLYVADDFIGFALFEPGPEEERVYQILSLNISTALSGAILLEKLDSSYRELVEQAHREGMTETATGILHNVENILNSVNISTQLIKDLTHNSPIQDFMKANQLLEANIDNLESFISNDPKGKKLMQFYIKLGEPLHNLQIRLLENINRLVDKINLIDEIVAAQQSYTDIKSTMEELDINLILEDAIKINLSSLEKCHIEIIRDYHDIPKVLVQRTKLFHVLVNLIANAKDAMLEVPEIGRKLVFITNEDDHHKFLRITDTGHGIPPDLLEMIFRYGYTTKKGGHGFGLHSCANYMTEMGGKIWAESEGPGRGATFVLQFSSTQAKN
jgi:signal transduction histidine kinase/DNA-binding LacI/PurR family transcriptional regulator